MTPFIAELIGTFLMIFLGHSVNANMFLEKTKGNRGDSSGWLFMSIGWAMAVFVGVSVAAPFSGAHLNPAVTIGLYIAGEFSLDSILPYIFAQFIGALLGAFFMWVIYKDHFDATPNKLIKRGVFCTDPAILNIFRNFLSECLGTFVLVLTVLYFSDALLLESNTKIGLGSIGALPVALVVWVIGMGVGGTTGYAINPVRDLAPRIIHTLVPLKDKASFNIKYAWIPVIAPILGGILASLLFLLLK